MYESDIEELAIEFLQQQGYAYLSAVQQEEERDNDPSTVILRERLAEATNNLNPDFPPEVRERAVRTVAALPSPSSSLAHLNKAFYNLLVEGVAEEYQEEDGNTRGARVQLIDFEHPENNDLVVCNQVSVTERNKTKRPDIVLFVNGLPLVVIELKNPTDEKAIIQTAFNQLQNYKKTIPSLFCYNGILVVSDGLDARAGALTAGWKRFMAWKTADGLQETATTTPQMETLIKGMLRPNVLLDLVRHFTVFSDEKKIAAYHQYYAVKQAVKSTIRASRQEAHDGVAENPALRNLPSAANQPPGDRKAGVVWHTQGSGKSLSMLFYAGLLVSSVEMRNPTIVVITDRNDLDDQLYGSFASGVTLLRQEPKQAKSRDHLKDLLRTQGGGVIFSTIQKFSPTGDNEIYDLLSERENIVIIADEAHRSQYGFGAKTVLMKDGAKTRYGFAKYLRDALPNASFIGFTGTPIEKEDINTPAVFGNYIDVYDIAQAIADGATVPIYYESRLVQVHLKDEQKEELDAAVDEVMENEEATQAEKMKAKWTRREAIIGHPDRVKTVAEDIINHFTARREAFEGKAMIVTTSRRIAVAMYDAICELQPDWRDKVRVVMTSNSSDPVEWEQHATNKSERQEIRSNFINPENPLQLVIVCDMWLTGFDAPCLDTLYMDKLMSGHNLMQAIARVNRVFKDKSGGLVVDYIGIASDLKYAVSNYTKSGGRGEPAFDQDQAVANMLEQHEVVAQMFHGFDYAAYFSADTAQKLELLLEAEEHILGLENGKTRFIRQVILLGKAFALSVPDKRAMAIKEEVGFFQAVKARLVKFQREEGENDDVDIETAIRQIVDKAVMVEGVIDVFASAGIEKPDIAVLSDEFLEEVKNMRRKNLALELLRKLLADEIKNRERRNLVQSKKFSEMLAEAIRKYKNQLLTAAEIIEELIAIAREIRASDERAEDLGLSDDEVAFYDALAMNESAKAAMEDDTLRELARMLVESVKQNASIDWQIRESTRAKMRMAVKRLLRKYGYPPDAQKLAVDRIVKQAELLSDETTSEE